MRAALELLTRCRSLGIALAITPAGALEWQADAEPPADLVAALALHKSELLAILSAPACDAPTAQPSEPPADPAPPVGAKFYFFDQRGRPCAPADAYLWTWASAPCWLYTAAHPIPNDRFLS